MPACNVTVKEAKQCPVLQYLVNQSALLVNGATEQDVLRTLGKPTLRWDVREGQARAFFGERPAQWVYGTTIDLHQIIIPELPFPNPVPIRFRLISSDEEDLVVDWTPDHKLSGVKRPDLHVPKGAEQLLAPIYFIADLARIFVLHRAN